MSRTVALAIMAAAAPGASRAPQFRKRANGRIPPRDSHPLPASNEFSSHDSLRRDSIDGLGYDWSRIANPHAQPRYPLRVYLLQTREELGCLTFISAYVKSIRSAYLSGCEPEQPFCELMFYLGVDGDRMTDIILEHLVSELDDLCIAHGAFRYMHSRTTKDPDRLRLLDPNAYYASAFAAADSRAAHAV